MVENIIQLNHVSKIYGKERTEVRALDDLSLEIKNNSVVTIMGPSGSGKSTLLNLIGTMDAPTVGDVFIDGTNISKYPESKLARFRRFTIGFVFQNYFLLPNIDLLGNVLAPLIPYGITNDDKARAQELLDTVGLGKRSKSKVKELSGGESQRVAIARSLINDPKIILGDEPTGNLDSENGKKIVDLLLSLLNKKKTIIIVTHNIEIGRIVSEHPNGNDIWLKDGHLSDKPTYNQFCW
jgi:putative ABC transport system ATP-binding protein